jgi:hypothetical protein
VLQNAASRVGALDLGFVPGEGGERGLADDDQGPLGGLEGFREAVTARGHLGQGLGRPDGAALLAAVAKLVQGLGAKAEGWNGLGVLQNAAVGALVDHEGARTDLDLVGAEVEQHVERAGLDHLGGLGVLQNAASRVGALDLGFVPGEGGLSFAEMVEALGDRREERRTVRTGERGLADDDQGPLGGLEGFREAAASRVGALDLGFVPGEGGLSFAEMVEAGALDVLDQLGDRREERRTVRTGERGLADDDQGPLGGLEVSASCRGRAG